MGGSLAAASGASAAASSAAADVVKQTQATQNVEESDSDFDVEVLGYGGGGMADSPATPVNSKPVASAKAPTLKAVLNY